MKALATDVTAGAERRGARIAADDRGARASAPLSEYLMRFYPALFGAICRHFASYQDVCDRLGLKPRRGRSRASVRRPLAER